MRFTIKYIRRKDFHCIKKCNMFSGRSIEQIAKDYYGECNPLRPFCYVVHRKDFFIVIEDDMGWRKL